MQPLGNPELGNSSTQLPGGSPAIHSIVQPVGSEPLITSSAVDTALLHTMFVGLNALHTVPHQSLQYVVLHTPRYAPLNDPIAPIYTTPPAMSTLVSNSTLPTSTINQALHVPSREGATPPLTTGSNLSYSSGTSLEQVMAKRFAEMEAMIQRILGYQLPSRKVLCTATRTHLSSIPSP